jgi:hypothetical protein
MAWILILWLTGCDSCGADYRGAITTQQFNNKDSCITALSFTRQQSNKGINGVCVPKGKES